MKEYYLYKHPVEEKPRDNEVVLLRIENGKEFIFWELGSWNGDKGWQFDKELKEYTVKEWYDFFENEKK